MVEIKKDKNGNNVVANNDQKNSRLLNSLGEARLMPQDQDNFWSEIFKKVAISTLKSRLEEAKEIMSEFTNPENIKNMESDELKDILLNSNLNDAVKINIESA